MVTEADKIKTACFTGHRQIAEESLPKLLSDLYSAVLSLIGEGITDFVCGGALGFDTLAAECVLAMQNRFENIKLCLVLPCRDQTKFWGTSDTQRYDRILHRANSVEYVADTYFKGCMHERNRRMVNKSSVCVAYLQEAQGGTAYTVSYAEKNNLRIINLGKCDVRSYQYSLFDFNEGV